MITPSTETFQPAGLSRLKPWASGILSALTAVTLLFGCQEAEVLTPKPDPKPGKADTLQITGLKVTQPFIRHYRSGEVEGAIRSTQPIKSVTYSVYRDTVSLGIQGNGFDLDYSESWAVQAWDLKTDGKLRLTVTGEVTPGEYAFKVTVVAGESTVTAIAPFMVRGRPEFQFGSFQVDPLGDDSAALYGGESRELIASVKGSEPLDSVWVTLLKDSIPQTQADGIWIAHGPFTSKQLNWESSLHGPLWLHSSLKAKPGEYVVQLRARIDDYVSMVAARFPFSPWAVQQVLASGAQGNATLGSFFDLDAPRMHLAASANAVQEEIDLLFVYHDGMLRIMSPVAAKSAGNINMANSFDSSRIKDVTFIKLKAPPVFLTEEWLAGAKVNSSPVAAGDSFLLKTAKGRYVCLEIASIDGTDSKASMAVKVLLAGAKVP